jgi:thiamine pyrophosphate-dependent acetolactate synthase large subunit-like protein
MSSSSGDATSPSSSSANKNDAKDKNAADDLADALGALSIQRTDDKAFSPATTKNLQKIADWIEESKAILVLTGAGVVRFSS